MRIINIISNFIVNTRAGSFWHKSSNIQWFWLHEKLFPSAELKCYKLIFGPTENNSKQNSLCPFRVLILPTLYLFWFCLHEVWEVKCLILPVLLISLFNTILSDRRYLYQTHCCSSCVLSGFRTLSSLSSFMGLWPTSHSVITWIE